MKRKFCEHGVMDSILVCIIAIAVVLRGQTEISQVESVDGFETVRAPTKAGLSKTSGDQLINLAFSYGSANGFDS